MKEDITLKRLILVRSSMFQSVPVTSWMGSAMSISPESAMSTSSVGGVPLSSSIFLTTSMPAVTLPKTTWRPSSQLVLTVQMKNWLPLVSGPALHFGLGMVKGSGSATGEAIGGLLCRSWFSIAACHLRPFNGECAGRGGDEAAP